MHVCVIWYESRKISAQENSDSMQKDEKCFFFKGKRCIIRSSYTADPVNDKGDACGFKQLKINICWIGL